MHLRNLQVVTSNPDKLKEINQILKTNFQISNFDIPEIQSLDVNEVIKDKAKKAFQIFKRPVLVEDISFEVEALKGLPGPFIKYFLKTVGTEGTVKLVGQKSTKTKVTAAIAIYDGKLMKIFKGTIYGTLSKKDKGLNGFGFDKVFITKGYTKTLAQMSPNLKNKISHRALALQKVKKYFEKIK